MVVSALKLYMFCQHEPPPRPAAHYGLTTNTLNFWFGSIAPAPLMP